MDFAPLRASNARYALVLSLLSGLTCLQHASFASAAVEADDALSLCQAEALPKDIRATLDRRFYGWKVQDSASLVAKARQKWASMTPLACPGIAAGHYEDSRSVSYALLLVPEDHSASGYKFVVFSAPAGQSFYGFKMLATGDVNASAFFIHAVPLDRVFDSALKKKYHPKGNEGILLAFLDDTAPTQDVYFWTGASYDNSPVSF